MAITKREHDRVGHPSLLTSRLYITGHDLQQMPGLLMEARSRTNDWRYWHVGALMWGYLLATAWSTHRSEGVKSEKEGSDARIARDPRICPRHAEGVGGPKDRRHRGAAAQVPQPAGGEFRARLLGAEIRDVTAHGKWLQAETTRGWLLLNLGMGGEILLTRRDRLPEKYRLIFDWEDGGCLAINFWWFGYVHLVEDLDDHPMVSNLGPDFLSLSLDGFQALLHGRRGGHQVVSAQPETDRRHRECLRARPVVQGVHSSSAENQHAER
jgi:hypothetical protein